MTSETEQAENISLDKGPVLRYIGYLYILVLAEIGIEQLVLFLFGRPLGFLIMQLSLIPTAPILFWIMYHFVYGANAPLPRTIKEFQNKVQPGSLAMKFWFPGAGMMIALQKLPFLGLKSAGPEFPLFLSFMGFGFIGFSICLKILLVSRAKLGEEK